MQGKKHNLVWIDLEMTGLDTATDQIIEIATIVTTTNLEVVAEGPNNVIHQAEEVLSGMDDWNTKHHTQSGLLEQVRRSHIGYAEAELGTLAFLQQHVEKGLSPMCGNSICQDRRFLARLMPELESFFHHRNLDVSTLKELAAYWMPQTKFKKESRHRAIDDVRDSIEELQFYRSCMLRY